jgi:hypothetical protein
MSLHILENPEESQNAGKTILFYDPMESEVVRSRVSQMKRFYDEELR